MFKIKQNHKMKNSIQVGFFRVSRLAMATFLFISFLSSCALLPSQSLTQKIPLTHLKTIHTLDVYAEENTLHALFSGIDKKSDLLELRYIQSLDAGKTWSEPVTINQGNVAIKKSKRGNDFQIASQGHRVMAIWRILGDEPWVGVIAVALSEDMGKTWRRIKSPVSDNYLKIDQGYLDLTADTLGNFHIVWLDDREEAGETQALRYARFSHNKWDYHKNLEQTACTCCWSQIASDAANNVHVLYRDDSPRDMMLISSKNGGKNWPKTTSVWPFNWEFVGCPHQGGGLAVEAFDADTILHTVVWNGHDNGRGLYYRHFNLTNNKESEAVQIGGENSASGDIAILENKQIGIVYTVRESEEKRVVAKFSEDHSKTWSKELQLTQEGAEPSHPRIVGTSEGFSFFWTEWQDDGNAIAIMVKLDR